MVTPARGKGWFRTHAATFTPKLGRTGGPTRKRLATHTTRHATAYQARAEHPR
jgi:hypothetical protein